MKWILAEMNIPFRELNINITRSGVFRFGWIPLIHRYHRINNRWLTITTSMFLERWLTWVKIILETPTQLTGWNVSAGRTVTSLLSEL